MTFVIVVSFVVCFLGSLVGRADMRGGLPPIARLTDERVAPVLGAGGYNDFE